MSNPCLNDGILQSYYDDQLSPQMLEQVMSHLASCASCAEAVRQVESEMEFTTGAFAAEMSSSVPTERLRSRLDEAIAGIGTQTLNNKTGISPRLRAWFGSLGSALNLSPQQAFGFASILVFFVLAAVVGGIVMQRRDNQPGFEVAAGTQRAMRELTFDPSIGPQVLPNGDVPEKQRGIRRTARRSGLATASAPASGNALNLAHRQLPGERNYLQAISLLTDAIEANGETSLKPTLLADYRRNLEVVNEAIKATQRTARTNPKSPDAAEMLFAVYQSKLDLLSAVAEQSQPMIAQR